VDDKLKTESYENIGGLLEKLININADANTELDRIEQSGRTDAIDILVDRMLDLDKEIVVEYEKLGYKHKGFWERYKELMDRAEKESKSKEDG